MDRREAIKALTRAGKQKDVAALIGEQAEKVRGTFDGIRADRTRTEEWRTWALGVASHRAVRALETELISRAQRVVGADRLDAERVFGVAGIPGDAASKSISRRDAGDRVASITEKDELRDLLTKATRQNDEILARAVAERAMEMGDADTLTQFAADRPDSDAAVERLWNAERSGVDTFKMTMLMSELLPPEVGSFETAEGIAAGPEPGAPESESQRSPMASAHGAIFTGSPGL